MSNKMNYRLSSLHSTGPSTLDVDTRSVDVVATTETPATIYDWARGTCRETLLMDGCEWPASGQVPLLNAHNRNTVGDVLGSFRDIRVDGGSLVGKVFFSKSDDGGVFEKMKEGHFTDFSVGYKQINSEWVPDGETKTIRGRSFQGPMLVTDRWRLKELSAVPIGADELAKARSEADEFNKKENGNMTEKIKQAEQPAAETPEQDAARSAEETQVRSSATETNTKKDIEDAIRAERERTEEITEMGDRFGMKEIAKQMIQKGYSVDHARKMVMDEMIKREKPEGARMQPKSGDIEVGADERDKFRAASEHGLLIRSGQRIEAPAPGAMDIAGWSLTELARHALKIEGKDAGGNRLEMVGRALTTTDFPLLLANVANKSLFAGWDTAEETWPMWCGTGSVPDFKTVYLPRVSETSDLDEIPEGMEYKYGARDEARESFSIATYGKLMAITRQTIINDDLMALTDIPRAHGEAAARKIGDLPYGVLTANSNMGDGNALFSTAHLNYVASGSGAIPGVSTIAAGILAMGTQKDLLGKRRLNIRPVFFIGPKTLEGAAEVFFRTDKFSDHSTVATDSTFASTRVNPYSGTVFTRVYEPRLDDDDTAAWYLAANKGRTVNVYFLNGQQRPFMETRQGWSVDGVEYKVRIDAGAKAVDWKGLYYNDGN